MKELQYAEELKGKHAIFFCFFFTLFYKFKAG